MKLEKQIAAKLSKCYSIAQLEYKGKPHFLVAAEKTDPCLLFDAEGNQVDTVWTEPGGTMSLVPIPGGNGAFLATHRFYSPNDSAKASIVLASPREEGGWDIRTVCSLPFVHRFDILKQGSTCWLIACTLKSDHEYKDDWTHPGKVYAAVLPDDLSELSEEHPLKLTVLKDGLTKNHGYYRVMENGNPTSLISAQEGVFQFVPPEKPDGTWQISQLLDTPASDAVMVDIDEDGKKELAVLSPFHGDTITIYHQDDKGYTPVYTFPEKAEFSHAIYGGMLWGRNRLVIGHRKGKMNLMSFTYNHKTNGYEMEVIDPGCGSTNVARFADGDKEFLISANREIDEVAVYRQI